MSQFTHYMSENANGSDDISPLRILTLCCPWASFPDNYGGCCCVNVLLSPWMTPMCLVAFSGTDSVSAGGLQTRACGLWQSAAVSQCRETPAGVCLSSAWKEGDLHRRQTQVLLGLSCICKDNVSVGKTFVIDEYIVPPWWLQSSLWFHHRALGPISSLSHLYFDPVVSVH